MGQRWEESELFRVIEESLTLAEQLPLGQGHLQQTAITKPDTEWGER